MLPVGREPRQSRLSGVDHQTYFKRMSSQCDEIYIASPLREIAVRKCENWRWCMITDHQRGVYDTSWDVKKRPEDRRAVKAERETLW